MIPDIYCKYLSRSLPGLWSFIFTHLFCFKSRRQHNLFAPWCLLSGLLTLYCKYLTSRELRDYRGPLFRRKTFYQVKEAWQRRLYIGWFYLYEISSKGNIWSQKVDKWLPRLEDENGKLLLMDKWFILGMMEIFCVIQCSNH